MQRELCITELPTEDHGRIQFLVSDHLVVSEINFYYQLEEYTWRT